MPAAEVINRIIRTAKDRGAPGRDSEYGYGQVDPTAALTAEVPAVVNNPLDTSPPPGVSRFGNAPAAGQALSAPDGDAGGPVSARASGATAGWAIEPPAEPASGASGTWWSAGAFFLIVHAGRAA